MYIKSGSEILDADLSFLEDILIVFDDKFLIKVNCMIQKTLIGSVYSELPGVLDRGEYIVGMGFAACQKYMNSTIGPIETKKSTALKLGLAHDNGEYMAAIINAAANYWKHGDEWKDISVAIKHESKMTEVNCFNSQFLSKQQESTIGVIESVTPWAEYACANILASITKSSELRLSKLIPILVEWRNQLAESRSNHGKRS